MLFPLIAGLNFKLNGFITNHSIVNKNVLHLWERVLPKSSNYYMINASDISIVQKSTYFQLLEQTGKVL